MHCVMSVHIEVILDPHKKERHPPPPPKKKKKGKEKNYGLSLDWSAVAAYCASNNHKTNNNCCVK